MAILVDFSQTVIASTIRISSGKTGIDEPNVDIIRHVVLDSIRKHRMKYKGEFGEIIVCVDGRNSWRKGVFPYYKAHRKLAKQKSDIPWDLVFECIDILKQELREFFPYKVVEVETAEADDVIAILTRELTSKGEKVMIISSDKDFKQLQTYPGVSQYSPLQDKQLEEIDPLGYLKGHIIMGDKGDGIPNIMSDDDVFVTDGKRQKPCGPAKVNQWIDKEPDDFCTNDTMRRNYDRNKVLVDLIHCVPEGLQEEIQQTFNEAHSAPRAGLLDYFTSNRLRNLTGKLQEF
jgi:hypothetical protein